MKVELRFKLDTTASIDFADKIRLEGLIGSLCDNLFISPDDVPSSNIFVSLNYTDSEENPVVRLRYIGKYNALIPKTAHSLNEDRENKKLSFIYRDTRYEIIPIFEPVNLSD